MDFNGHKISGRLVLELALEATADLEDDRPDRAAEKLVAALGLLQIQANRSQAGAQAELPGVTRGDVGGYYLARTSTRPPGPAAQFKLVQHALTLVEFSPEETTYATRGDDSDTDQVQVTPGFLIPRPGAE